MSEPYELSNDFVEARNIKVHFALEGDDSKPLLALINMASVNLT